MASGRPGPGPWVRCLNCGDVFRSEHVHDWRRCRCGCCFVDGGGHYTRMGGLTDKFKGMPEVCDGK